MYHDYYQFDIRSNDSNKIMIGMKSNWTWWNLNKSFEAALITTPSTKHLLFFFSCFLFFFASHFFLPCAAQFWQRNQKAPKMTSTTHLSTGVWHIPIRKFSKLKEKRKMNSELMVIFLLIFIYKEQRDRCFIYWKVPWVLVFWRCQWHSKILVYCLEHLVPLSLASFVHIVFIF